MFDTVLQNGGIEITFPVPFGLPSTANKFALLKRISDSPLQYQPVAANWQIIANSVRFSNVNSAIGDAIYTLGAAECFLPLRDCIPLSDERCGPQCVNGTCLVTNCTATASTPLCDA